MGDEEIEELEQVIARRVVTITVDSETGQLELDDGGLASWELCGLAGWLEMVAHEMLQDDVDGDEDA